MICHRVDVDRGAACDACRNENEAAHEAIASVLWESSSDADALSALRRLGLERSAEWEQEVRGANDRG